ncbi:uncharacterized protein BT62DRAFT_1009824 [Guyanagaster necrorhizus]|uniref:Uncharacterized protein n=1 Tax=Guyanagaster necrorhizus TaxID=856835 RepID=A0A9P7VLP5_9AGAR|nr:uncharacterized protein BT62DRAFT_1009824 [Guyanagaster necrorhizus MCA 3950]KAG7442825.1 hypothetical protein BT62DRAFT_1009824 [Guyanagaster necrorhizus MCA 3950]
MILGVDFRERVSHQILTVRPDVSDRANANLVISSSRHIFDLLEERLQHLRDTSLTSTYTAFFTPPNSQSTAHLYPLAVPQRMYELQDIVDLLTKLTASPTLTAYFKPTKPNEATLDAVIFHSSHQKLKRQIDVVQATVGQQHGVKEVAVEKLHKLGVALRYVAVVPQGQVINFTVQPRIANMFKKATYYIEVSSDDIGRCSW